MTKRKLKALITTGFFVVCGGAFAQAPGVRPAYQFPSAPRDTGPATVQVADTPLFLQPYLGVATGYDDNLFLSNSNKKSSVLYVANPGFKMDARDPNKVLQLNYSSQVGRYGQSEDDDYVDHTVHSQIDIAFDRRNFMRLGVDYLRNHDPRGSTDRSSAARPDRYELTSPFVTYAFGAPGSAGRLEAYYSGADKHYLNNRDTTITSDRRTHEFGSAFYWRVMPKTYALVEARETRIDYRLSTSTLDARERRLYGGIAWEATAATTGTLKFGGLRRQFDSDRPSFSGASWEGGVSWAPRTYSKFDFFTVRQTSESTGLGNFILSSIAGVAWNHSWNSFLTTGVTYRFQKDEYQGFDRTDKTNSLGLRVGYKVRRWLTLGAEYSYTKRDTNVQNFEYDKNLYLLTATGTL